MRSDMTAAEPGRHNGRLQYFPLRHNAALAFRNSATAIAMAAPRVFLKRIVGILQDGAGVICRRADETSLRFLCSFGRQKAVTQAIHHHQDGADWRIFVTPQPSPQ